MTAFGPVGQPLWLPPHWAPPTTTDPIGRRWLVPVLLGAAALVVGIVLGTLATLGTLDTPVLDGQGSIREAVHPGTYDLYAQSGTSNGGGGFTFTDSYEPHVNGDAIHVSLDGQPLVPTAYDHGYSSTLQRGNRTFLAVALVQVPRNGTLTLVADSNEGALVIAPTIGGTATKLIAPGLLGLAGLALLVGGGVARIRAGSRRKPIWVQGHWAAPGTPV